jgi:hypothetical protein
MCPLKNTQSRKQMSAKQEHCVQGNPAIGLSSPVNEQIKYDPWLCVTDFRAVLPNIDMRQLLKG